MSYIPAQLSIVNCQLQFQINKNNSTHTHTDRCKQIATQRKKGANNQTLPNTLKHIPILICCLLFHLASYVQTIVTTPFFCLGSYCDTFTVLNKKYQIIPCLGFICDLQLKCKSLHFFLL